MEELWNSEFSLKELVSDDKFKNFDELKTKLDRVLGLGGVQLSPSVKKEDAPFDGGQPYTAPPKPAAETVGESEEGMDYFQKLAETA
jgi:hypothetical protein